MSKARRAGGESPTAQAVGCGTIHEYLREGDKNRFPARKVFAEWKVSRQWMPPWRGLQHQRETEWQADRHTTNSDLPPERIGHDSEVRRLSTGRIGIQIGKGRFFTSNFLLFDDSSGTLLSVEHDRQEIVPSPGLRPPSALAARRSPTLALRRRNDRRRFQQALKALPTRFDERRTGFAMVRLERRAPGLRCAADQ